MTTEVEDLIREMDATIEGLTTGNRELDLQMIEFLINLDERVAALLKAQSDRVDRKLFDELHDRAKELSFENRDLGSALAEREARITELLEKEDGLRQQVALREADVRDAVAEGEAWKDAFHHVRNQILSMAKEQGNGNALIREHLEAAQTALESEAEETKEAVEVMLEWTPSSERAAIEDDIEDAEQDEMDEAFERAFAELEAAEAENAPSDEDDVAEADDLDDLRQLDGEVMDALSRPQA